MSGAHLHLLLTHVPVVGIVFGLLVLAYAWFSGKNEIARVSLGIFVLSGLAAVAVYLTGEPAEEVVEGLPGVSHALIEQHEEAAVAALIAALVLGAVSLMGLWLSRRSLPRWLSGATLVLALVVSGIMAWTANLGGQINHPEIRSDAAIVSADGETEGDGAEAGAAYEHEDD